MGLPAVLCLIAVLSAGCGSESSTTESSVDTPTFARDIAPIVYENCSACHRPGEAGPFPLLTYDDVRGRAQLIQTVIESRYMPPWLPEPGYGEFEEVRRLTDDQIETFKQWVAGGTPEGDASETPPLPEWTDGWQLGEPDLVIQMPEMYELPASGPDVFRNFAVPIPLSERKYIRAFEFRPDNAKIVHHARMLFDETGSSHRRDAEDAGPGFSSSMFVDDIFDPSGHWIGWTPGKQPAMRSPEIAWELRPGTDMVLEMHMVPTGKPEKIQSRMGFYFSDQEPTRTPFIIRMGSKTIDIVPGDENYEIKDRYVLPVDTEVLAVYPHAHYLATEMEGWAVLPDGKKQSLLRIDQWDFDWQDEYRYEEPPFLPKGTAIEMRFLYDNSTRNPRNPSDPPVRVTYGWQTEEEMGDLWFQVVPRHEEDWSPLYRDFSKKERAAQIAGYEKQLETHPKDHEKQNALGNLYLEIGETGKAIPRFRQALSIKPDYPYAHYNLGVASEALGKMDQAIEHYRTALRYAPDHAPSHNNLAIALVSRGDASAAMTHLKQAIASDPNYAEAQSNLGIVYGSQRDFDNAIKQFKAALRIDPDYAEAHNNLANTYAAKGQFDEAIRHYQHALAIVPNYEEAKRNLALVERAKSEQ